MTAATKVVQWKLTWKCADYSQEDVLGEERDKQRCNE